MKKTISIILAMTIIILNTFLPPKIYAANEVPIGTPIVAETGTQGSNGGTGQSSSSTTKFKPESFSNVVEQGMQAPLNELVTGKATVNGRQEQIEETGGTFNAIIRLIAKVLGLIPEGIETLLSLITSRYTVDGSYQASSVGFNWFTIQDTVFGKIKLFDINFFDTSIGNNIENNPNVIIKESTRDLYYTLRSVAMIGNLLVLVYVGIRMAISTVASDQAKYKQMLINWVTSFIILFILPYIFALVLNLSGIALDLVPKAPDTASFERTIDTNIYKDMDSVRSMRVIGAFFTLCLLTYYHVSFFAKYIIRFFKIAFLIIISPIITVMYALDKGSAHKKWLKEFISAVFMQVVHALIYTIFLLSASEIATKAPIVTVAFFMALKQGEKIFDYLFDLKEQ